MEYNLTHKFNTAIINRNLYVTIENIPNTDFLPTAKFCYKDKNDIENLAYFAIVIKCTKIYSGRFLLLHHYRKPEDLAHLHINELYIFGKETSLFDKEGIYF